jgi:hypothetical protein
MMSRDKGIVYGAARRFFVCCLDDYEISWRLALQQHRSYFEVVG